MAKSMNADANRNAFISAIRSIGDKQDAATVGIFEAASRIAQLLPEKIEDSANKVFLDRVELLRKGLSDPALRSVIRKPLLDVLGPRPAKGSERNEKLRSSYDQWQADTRNIERALHVALIVWSGNNQIAQFDGATFSMAGATLLDGLNKNAKPAKDGSTDPIVRTTARTGFRVIFGKAKPDKFTVVHDSGAVRSIKASFATLTAAFPMITTGKNKAKRTKAQPDAFVTITKAMFSVLKPETTAEFNDTQREVLMLIRGEIDKRLGIKTVGDKKVPAKRTKAPKTAPEQQPVAA